VEILKLMSSTFLVGLCQAIDLRHVEETMQSAVKQVVSQVAKKTLFMSKDGTLLPSRFCEKDLLLVVERQPVFSYIDDASSDTYPLMEKLRAVLVGHALKLHKEASTGVFQQIPIFEAEVQERLRAVVPLVREAYDNKGLSAVANRIESCRTYPLYQFVRAELGTQLLSGLRTVSPGTEIEKVFQAMSEGKLIKPLLQCVDGWTGAPGPFPHQQ